MPPQFPPWAAVYHYFYRWQRLGLWQQLHTVVNVPDRVVWVAHSPRRWVVERTFA
ncbi:transposase [Hymenobacter sp. BT186]|uniref:Transposase n=1 Tax=Hymenobacter telluris TaxID=2816474 RepID=A0A939JB85_9BACT|nr:transposase [Hymenobacter telluris]MBW3373082.1 transposase [Hymenobacter norwichensis]